MDAQLSDSMATIRQLAEELVQGYPAPDSESNELPDGTAVDSWSSDIGAFILGVLNDFYDKVPRSIPKREAIIPNDYILGELAGERDSAGELNSSSGHNA